MREVGFSLSKGSGKASVFPKNIQALRSANAATALSVLQGAVFLIPVFYILSRVGIYAMASAVTLSIVMALAVVIFWMARRAKSEGFDNFLMLESPEVDKVCEMSIG